jgi:hypothetical protein
MTETLCCLSLLASFLALLPPFFHSLVKIARKTILTPLVLALLLPHPLTRPATDPWATCLSSQAYASLSSSESNKDCWERLGVAGFLRDYKHFCKEREKEKKVDQMATNQSVVEFLWEGRVVVRPPRCGEKVRCRASEE